MKSNKSLSPIELIQKRLSKIKLDRDDVGNKITFKVPIANIDETLGEVYRRMLASIKDLQTINYVYVLDKNQRLKGVFSIKELFSQSLETCVSDIMEVKVNSCLATTKETDCIKIALDSNIKAVPIIDKKSHFLGVLDNDAITSTINNELQEDMFLSAGILTTDDEYNFIKDKLVNSIFIRLPWIIFGLFGGLIGARVVQSFNQILSQHIILASFLPLVVYLGSAVGNQTQTIFLRDLAVREKIGLSKHLFKHALVNIVIALVCGLIVTSLVTFFWSASNYGSVIGLAIVSTVIISTFVAIVIPYIITKLNLDPANGSGPFSTIVQDILSIIIFF